MTGAQRCNQAELWQICTVCNWCHRQHNSTHSQPGLQHLALYHCNKARMLEDLVGVDWQPAPNRAPPWGIKVSSEIGPGAFTRHIWGLLLSIFDRMINLGLQEAKLAAAWTLPPSKLERRHGLLLTNTAWCVKPIWTKSEPIQSRNCQNKKKTTTTKKTSSSGKIERRSSCRMPAIQQGCCPLTTVNDRHCASFYFPASQWAFTLCRGGEKPTAV